MPVGLAAIFASYGGRQGNETDVQIARSFGGHQASGDSGTIVVPGGVGRQARLGVNVSTIGFTFSSSDCSWLNVIHGLQGWDPRLNNGVAVQGPTTVGVEGFPIATSGSGISSSYVAINNDFKRPGCETDYVLVTSRTGWNPSVDGARGTVRSTPTLNGVVCDRVEFSVSGAGPGSGFYRLLSVYNVDAKPWRDGQDFMYLCRKSDEAKYLAGRYITDRARAVFGQAGGNLRFMDAGATNNSATKSMDQYTKKACAFWGTGEAQLIEYRMPLEVQCGIANEVQAAFPNVPVTPHFCIPAQFSDAAVRQFVRVIKANLNPVIPANIELSNEHWNFDFGQYGYFHDLYNPCPVASSDLIIGDPAIPNYGYRAAQVAALIQDEDGYTGRFSCVLGSHAARPDVTHDAMAGVRAWMTANPSAFNGRYGAAKPMGQLFPLLSPANYMGVQAADPANTAMIESWADATDDSGAAAYFDELYNANRLPVHAPVSINGLTAYYARHLALAQAENMALLAYEGGYSQERYNNSAKVQNFCYRMEADPRARAATKDTAVKSLEAGFASLSHYWDCDGGAGGGYQYGLLRNVYDLSDPRWLGQTDAVAAMPVIPEMKLTLTTTGAFTIGKAPITTAHVTGGQGPYKFACSGLAPGRTYDGYATVTGKLTNIGAVQGTFSVTDQRGITKTVTFDQNVVAAPVGPRFFKVRPLVNFQYNGPVAANNNGSRVGTAENTLRDSSGAVIAYQSGSGCVSGSNYGPNNPALIVDGRTNPSYITDDTGKVNGGEYIIDLGDGTAAIPASIDIYSCPESSSFRIGALDIWAAKDPGGLGAAPTYAQLIAAADFSMNVAHFPGSTPNDPNPACSYTDSNTGYWRVPLTYPT